MQPEVLPTDIRRALEAVVRKIHVWCPTMSIQAPAMQHCNYSQEASGSHLRSSFDALKDSWLALPTNAFPSDAVVDWSPRFQCPTFKYPTGTRATTSDFVPHPLRAMYGPPPPALPVTFSNPRVEKYFGSPNWLSQNRIVLGDPFHQSSIPGNEMLKSLSHIESFSRESLKGTSVLWDVVTNYLTRIDSFKKWALDLRSSGVSAPIDDLEALIDEFADFCSMLQPSLRRSNLISASAAMTAKKQARVLVLARFNGDSQMKQTLLHSDFGVGDLFGPLNHLMQANADMYHRCGNLQWRLTLRKNDGKRGGAPPSSPYGPAKVPKRTNAAQAAPVAKAVKSPFLESGLGKGRGKGRGRGSKGK